MERGGKEIVLTRREYGLLEFLMRHRGEAVTKRAILENVWDAHFAGDPNIVEVYIGYLRRKLETAAGVRIETVRGAGYRLAADGG